MDLVFPIVALLLILTGVVLLPAAEAVFRRAMYGIAELRSELLVQAAQRIHQRRQL